MFETESPYYDADKSRTHGKIFVLDEDINGDGRFNINDLQWSYLKGDGDFRSDEVKALRNEADIIITNPPFSLFREFFAWIMEAAKKFVVICNKNCVSYKEIFPYIKDNLIWVGSTPMSQDLLFEVPQSIKEMFIKEGKEGSNYKVVDGKVFGRSTSIWITNIDHGRRHEPLPLMSMEDNILYSKHKEIKGKGYVHYENYDAIDVPFYDAIPSDYDGLIGVPRSFLDKFCPEQFEIIGNAEGDAGKELGFMPYPRELRKLNKSLRDGQPYYFDENGMPQKPFGRIIIRKKQ